LRTPDFGLVAAVYDEVRPLDGLRRELLEALVREGALGGGRVLDVGCGTGQLVAQLSERGVAAVGVDVSPEMLEVARAKLPNGVFEPAPAERLPFADGSFDRVVYLLVVHLVDRAAAFAEARRVLAPGGRVAIATFATSHFGSYYLNSYFPSVAAIDEARFPSEDRLRAELAAAGFGTVRVMPLRQHATIDRETVLRRVRARHISTLQLLDEAEYAAGVAQLETELPAVVGYTSDFLIVSAER
jgi:SAM-dependent methyltransferase